MSAAVEEKIRDYILANYLFTSDAAALRNEDSFMKRGIIDSTGILEVIQFLDDEFGVKVADEEMTPENLDSVSNLVAFVARKNGAA
jgi:acyl carrier protein